MQIQATLDLSTIEWSLVGGVFLAKLVVFALVSIVSILTGRRKPTAFIEGGLRGEAGRWGWGLGFAEGHIAYDPEGPP